jgi:hypothetical protein
MSHSSKINRSLLRQTPGATARTLASVCAGTLAAILSVNSAAADARLWDGSLTISKVSAQCPAEYKKGSFRALYRAQLKSGDPEAAIIFQADNLNHTFVIRATTNTATLQGTAEYCGIDLDPRRAEPKVWTTGTYNITVNPPAVTDATLTVHVTGSATRFADVAGCTISFRAAFLRRP